jgi:diketogulonate reductase-like aldo/keto reductase
MAAASLELNTGQRVPPICFGGGQRIREGRVFEEALEAGYRFFDTAFTYRNDHLVFDSDIGRRLLAEQRERIVVCSKTSLGHSLPVAVHEALDRMGVGYLDLLLLHHPIGDGDRDPLGRLSATWEAMEQLVDVGLVGAIGLSNTGCSLLGFVLDGCRIPPAVDQVEFHPYLQQRELLAMCTAAGVRLQAYCPLGSPWRRAAAGAKPPTADPVVTAIADAKRLTPSQIVLRWHMDKGVIPVVSATQVDHMRENLGALDLEPLAPAETRAIDDLDRQERIWTDAAKLAGLCGTVTDGVLTIPESWPQ